MYWTVGFATAKTVCRRSRRVFGDGLRVEAGGIAPELVPNDLKERFVGFGEAFPFRLGDERELPCWPCEVVEHEPHGIVEHVEVTYDHPHLGVEADALVGVLAEVVLGGCAPYFLPSHGDAVLQSLEIDVGEYLPGQMLLELVLERLLHVVVRVVEAVADGGGHVGSVVVGGGEVVDEDVHEVFELRHVDEYRGGLLGDGDAAGVGGLGEGLEVGLPLFRLLDGATHSAPPSWPALVSVRLNAPLSALWWSHKGLCSVSGIHLP